MRRGAYIIGAGVFHGGGGGVMNENAPRFACRFDAMARGAKALKKVTPKSGGAYLSPRKNVVNVGGLRYLPTEQASGAKGGGA